MIRFLIQFGHLEQEKQPFALYLLDFCLSLSAGKETDIMYTLETETLRRELLRDILDIDSPELLKKLRLSFDRICTSYMPVVAQEDLTPYTMEELDARIDEAEAEEDAGTSAASHEEVMKRMRTLVATL